MSEPFIGQVSLFSFNYPPYGWALCAGSSVNIQQQAALYSLIGTQFGGDGKTTFMLPDLRSRVMAGAGQMPGSRNIWKNGTKNGVENVTLDLAHYPLHNHLIEHLNLTATLGQPSASPSVAFGQYHPAATVGIPSSEANTTFIDSSITMTGMATPQPHENRQPYLALNPCIAISGDYPDFDN